MLVLKRKKVGNPSLSATPVIWITYSKSRSLKFVAGK
jgi:hypothetical protein